MFCHNSSQFIELASLLGFARSFSIFPLSPRDHTTASIVDEA